MKFCIAHYPEGAGHATRMLSIGQALEDQGHEIVLAGGGPGKKFVELNGYEEEVPTEVNFVDDYQENGLLSTLKSGFNSVKRTFDFIQWFKQEQPDCIVTDDMFAGLAAILNRSKFYFVTHNAGFLYSDTGEKIGAQAWNRVLARRAEKFFYPSVWKDRKPPGTEKVGPLAPVAGSREEPGVDVLMVPSAYSEDRNIEETLEDEGRSVTVVGGEDWEIQKSLQPHIKSAELVVCSGYSTIMECAVAGTSCLIIPETSEQLGVAREISKDNVKGFSRVEDESELSEALQTIEKPSKQHNGSEEVADLIIQGLS